MLMHVAPDEVARLQQAAQAQGGSLTINPHTGLPEADFFSDIWKTIKPVAAPLAGAALTYLSGGALSPLTAGLITGGVGALATGSLQKGLMAGLGAYGGASLGSALGSLGEASALQAAAPGAAEAMAGLSGDAANQAANEYVQKQMADYASKGALDKLGSGLGYAMDNPSAALSTLGGGSTMAGAGKLAALGLPVLSAIQSQQTTKMPTLASVTPNSYIRPYVLNRTQNTAPSSGPGEYRYFNDEYAALTPYLANRSLATGGAIAFNQGGLGSLGGYSDGGRLLRGPGDGVSDNIPATIGDRQPARLADGEFVVPARIVSEIGNGSTEAGARKLYAMMDRVQKARRKTVGHGRVATDTNAERLLPA
jgi:hypothetical protein